MDWFYFGRRSDIEVSVAIEAKPSCADGQVYSDGLRQCHAREAQAGKSIEASKIFLRFADQFPVAGFRCEADSHLEILSRL